MILNTEKKAKEFVKELGVMEFVFTSDNIVTYKTPIPFIDNDVLNHYEVTFFLEDCDTFYKMDSFNNFLSCLTIFEIKKIIFSSDSNKTLYHRKYNSSEIINSEEEVLKSMNINN